MPRENRKRGKKNKKSKEEEYPIAPTTVAPEPEPELATPSWITSAPATTEEVNAEAPFGYVDVDVKAYFRTVDTQIRDWQDNAPDPADADQDIDPNEERHMFFVAALTEMTGKEKQLATDPDCSFILERMTYSMDDFVRRVFVDSLSGSYETLVRHRFASHVCQTLFTVAADTVSREYRGILPKVPESDPSERGELLTLTQLILDVCKELLPSLTSLIMDPFASHVIRALLLLLSPSKTISTTSVHSQSSAVRSKKSAAWKSRQGPLKSVFDDKGKHPQSQNAPSTSSRSVPPEFTKMARKFVRTVQKELGENETRALAANKVASPVLQILLDIETDHDMADSPGSLMDRVMVGIITTCHENPDSLSSMEPSDYLNTLLHDPTSSHLLETIVSRCPETAFAVLWSTYFHDEAGKAGTRGRLLPRLATHPVANFVLAKALERANAEQLGEACEVLEGGGWSKLVKSAKTGVLRAMIDRAAAINSLEKEIGEAMFTAFDLTTPEDHTLLVPCVLRLKPLDEYQTALAAQKPQVKDSKPQHGYGQRNNNANDDPMEPTVQGALLLQSLLRLSAPHNQLASASLTSLPMDELLGIAHHATSSRVLDALLESPSVPMSAKRQFVLGFIGHYERLVDDRIGSRVGDRCWAFADTYLKEKIARSLVPHEQFLAGSYYGKFFARNLNLYLLQRRPEDWRKMQTDRAQAALAATRAAQPTPVSSSTLPDPVPTSTSAKKRKREGRPDNEIDALFDATLGKKIKKGALPSAVPVPDDIAPSTVAGEKTTEAGLDEVLGAIRLAPKDEKEHKKKKKARTK